MKKLIFIIISLIFPSLSVAQSSVPYRLLKCDYQQSGKIKQIKYSLLPASYYPWGVCFHKPSFINNVKETTEQEDMWTRSAMDIWNKGYKRYKNRRWGNGNPVNLPGTLFTESCDRDRYNIIYTVKKEIPGQRMEQIFVNNAQDSYIVVQIEQKNWDRLPYINTMLHELGHALGIQHLPRRETEVMRSHDQGCPKGDTCAVTDTDFESFLWPYNPYGLIISAEDIRWEKTTRRLMMGCPDSDTFVILDDEDTKQHVKRMATSPSYTGLRFEVVQ